LGRPGGTDMPTFDDRGLPTGSTHEAARHAVESALWRMMAFYDTPMADLDAASAFDPAWPLPHAMKAGFLFSLTEPLTPCSSYKKAAGPRPAGPGTCC
jgi:hypothetical protein